MQARTDGERVEDHEIKLSRLEMPRDTIAIAYGLIKMELITIHDHADLMRVQVQLAMRLSLWARPDCAKGQPRNPLLWLCLGERHLHKLSSHAELPPDFISSPAIGCLCDADFRNLKEPCFSYATCSSPPNPHERFAAHWRLSARCTRHSIPSSPIP